MKKSLVAALLAGGLAFNGNASASLPLEKETLNNYFNAPKKIEIVISDKNKNEIIDSEEVGKYISYIYEPKSGGRYNVIIINPQGEKVYRTSYDLAESQPILVNFSDKIKSFGEGKYTLVIRREIDSERIEFDVKSK